MASLDTDFALSPSLQTELTRLRQLNTLDIQRCWQWHSEVIDEAIDIEKISASSPHQWPISPLNERHHIAWEKGRQVRWLYHRVTVPSNLYGYPLSGLILRLALTWWADDAQIYVNGALIQSGDLFECFTRICLSSSVRPNETFEIMIRLVSPGHDNGALVRSQLIYELPTHQPTPEPSFIADELTVLATLEPSHETAIQTALSQLDWNSLENAEPDLNSLNIWDAIATQAIPIAAVIHPFQQSLSQLRRNLLPLCKSLQNRTIQCVGHAHLDMAWLWPVADTWQAAERTFKSVLNLQKEFPKLTYTHSSPALFEWIEQNRPELFQQIQQQVQAGKWSIDAGLWIEPEFNIISGEAITRHILYGQRYCQEKFGSISKIAWLPDSFGFCWQLPQLLTQGGIETFATLKLSWNDTTEFPYQLFWWQSPDGSRILSLMLPPIGSDIDPVKMAHQAQKWQESTHIPDALWLPGLGDHGGGPTRDMLQKAKRWENSPFFPQLKFTTPNTYISKLPLSADPTLPIWNNELYLELHRGCYTTHADQKQFNRQCEDLLYQAEVFATIAQLTAGHPYPKADIEAAWKTLLFNQFHDILPGTSIPEVFVDANQGWQQVQQIGQKVLDESLSAIASNISLPSPPHPTSKPILVFNSLSWPIDTVVTFNLSTLDSSTHPSTDPSIDSRTKQSEWIIYDSNQQIIPSQLTTESSSQNAPYQLSFPASNIPAVGYRCYWIQPAAPAPIEEPIKEPIEVPIEVSRRTEYVLENKFLKVSINPLTGQIVSLIEKSTQRETFSTSGNQLQIFRDQSGYWDAWNIAADYSKHPLPEPQLSSIQWHETGSIRQCIRTIYKTKKSTICQDYILDITSPFLTVRNTIDWQETQVLLKVNFPIATSANIATYEIPFGAIARPTQPQTEAEKAKWEVSALRWADLGNEDFGVSILTNGKHGFDASPTHLRLTLLKSPIWPDSAADKGTHHFSYAIYPHASTWQTAHTAKLAREFSIHPIATPHQAPTIKQHVKKQPTSTPSKTVSHQSFLELKNPNLILSAFKPSEDNLDEIILRCYECHGESTDLNLQSAFGPPEISKTHIIRTNLLESPLNDPSPSHISAWQIATYHMKPKKPS